MRYSYILFVLIFITSCGGSDSDPSTGPAMENVDSGELTDDVTCLASGIYTGSYSGDGNGNVVVLLDPQKDKFGFSWVYVENDRAWAVVQRVFDETTNGMSLVLFENLATFDGVISPNYQIYEGTWENDFLNIGGNFMATRVNGNTNAKYRLAGTAIGDVDSGFGGYSIDIFEDESYSGTFSSLDGTTRAFSGNEIIDNTIEISTGNLEVTLTLNLDGSADLDPGDIDYPGTSPGFIGAGTFNGFAQFISGTSCQLNTF